MALRDQPYLPLYVQDYLTDEKLNSCTASSQGVYIKIMCILHKQEEYGVILLKQKDKQNSSTTLNFACKLAKLLPFDTDTILSALEELIEEGVLKIEGDKLSQKRMVKDGEISEARSLAAKKGGGNPNLFKQNSKQKDKQNPEYEYENNNVFKGGMGGNFSESEFQLLGTDLKAIEAEKDMIAAKCDKQGNYIEVMKAFSKWRNYRRVTHGFEMSENQFTYQVLNDALKRIPAEGIIEAIEHSIVSGYKKIYQPNPSDPPGTKHKPQTEKPQPVLMPMKRKHEHERNKQAENKEETPSL